MTIKENNFAFIDSQNVNLGVRELNWKLDWQKFRVYLREKYGVRKAYVFIGYLPENQNLYRVLQEAGYFLIFRPVLKNKNGEVKGNVDADLVLRAMIDFSQYDKAVVVTSDGDFYCLVEYLYKKNKLKLVISPNRDKCSVLLTKTAKEKLDFMNNLRRKLEYIK
ncbi:NYN domain-containing protein [Patescibacteria group bacterium]|nr:NYN domain-containing protein [Patescibacteria group bacterium]MBU1922555.1 NYN domain-containing protein [Patescibacteria group bacterium]